MKAATWWYIVRPFVILDAVVWVLIVPSLVAILSSLIPSLKHEVPLLSLLLGLTAPLQLGIGLWIRVHYIKPAVQYLEGHAMDEAALALAVRQASRLPLIDVLVFYFLRCTLLSLLPVMVGLVFMDKVTMAQAVFGACLVSLIVASFTPYYYLAGENNLVPFYARVGAHKSFGQTEHVLRLSMKNKILMSILLTSVPAAICYLAVIIYTDYANISRQGVYLGLTLLMAQMLILSFLNSALLTRGFSRSVGHMSNMLSDMAAGQGDLTRRLTVAGVDEVGRLAFSFNAFVDNLDAIIRVVKGATEQIYQTVGEVHTGSQGISETTQEQASSIQQVAASVEEMHSSIAQATDLAHEGREASQSLTKLVEAEYADFNALLQAMQAISRASHKISDIVSTVNEVAFQTNLLALNAAVEAARAGEQGKGFAVVADEVRALAVRSGNASREISDLITDTVGRIREGDAMMQKTMQRFQGLKDTIDAVSKVMETISASAQEQNQGITELSQAITQIDTATQHNAATVEELAGTAQVMNDEAQILAENVERFKVSEGDAAA
ncbi:MAG: methyl-accepting chemotaxis protein [Syntrophaceae bacterium]